MLILVHSRRAVSWEFNSQWQQLLETQSTHLSSDRISAMLFFLDCFCAAQSSLVNVFLHTLLKCAQCLTAAQSKTCNPPKITSFYTHESTSQLISVCISSMRYFLLFSRNDH